MNKPEVVAAILKIDENANVQQNLPELKILLESLQSTEHHAETPDAETPDAETPDAETPDAETPDAETPDAETPDAETPDAETPEDETPEDETPEDDVCEHCGAEATCSAGDVYLCENCFEHMIEEYEKERNFDSKSEEKAAQVPRKFHYAEDGKKPICRFCGGELKHKKDTSGGKALYNCVDCNGQCQHPKKMFEG